MKGFINDSYDGDDPVAVRMSTLGSTDNLNSISVKDFPTEEAQGDLEAPQSFLEKYHSYVKTTLISVIHISVGCFFAYATYFYIVVVQNRSQSDAEKDPNDGRCYVGCSIQFCNGYGMLVLILGFVYLGLLYYFVIKPKVGQRIHKGFLKPFGQKWSDFSRTRIASVLLIIILLLALSGFLYYETKDKPQKVIGIIAPIIFILLGVVFSTSQKNIPWRTVITGIVLQFLLGVVCIRWKVGRDIFDCLGEKVSTFLDFSKSGSLFVFGSQIMADKVFAFAILPVIFFFSFFISILYYLGTMQWIVLKLGWMLQEVMGTTVCESVTCAANIFLGMSESPLLIRPYIRLQTTSELHAIMVSGFATVSGTVLAAYKSFGADPAHLITSSVMAAPAALAISKLYLPETEESKTTSKNMRLQKSEDTSLLDAAANGASQGIPIILGIIANIVAFVSFITFLNALVNWCGYLVGLDDITFEWIFSKLFIPLAWSMGVPWKDCDTIAKVIAGKTIINEFYAYEMLGKFIEQGVIEARSAGIATFAICGFANPSSLGILVGSLSAMAPERRKVITAVAFRAFVVGSIVCFISASFAGLLLVEEETAKSYQKFLETKMLERNRTMLPGFLPV